MMDRSQPYYRVINTNSRDEWLDARRPFVTASEIGVLARGNPTDWERLREEKRTGVQSFQGNEYTRWGNEREPHILEWVKVNVNSRIRPNDQLHVSTQWPKYAATPDGLSEDGMATCQVKTTTHPFDPARPPQHYYDQVQWEMMVTGARQCVLAVEHHINFEPLSTTSAIIRYDQQRVTELQHIADRFLAGMPPVPQARGELTDAIDAWAAAEEHLAQAKTRAQEAKRKVVELIGDEPGNRFMSSMYQVVRTPETTRTTVDRQKLQEEFPEAWEACQKTTRVAPIIRTPKRLEG